MPTLLFLNGPQAGSRVPIVGDRFVLGRAAECDAVVPSAPDAQGSSINGVSRRHALVSCVNGQWYIEDGDGQGRPSRNGTYLNNQRLPNQGRAVLHHDDRIRICGTRLAFHLDPESTFTPEAALSHVDSGLGLASQSADRLRMLLDVSTALRGTLDPDAVLHRTLDHLFRMFPQAERGVIVFREDPDGPLAVRVLRTTRDEPVDARFSTTVVRRCIGSVEAVLGNDLPAQFPNSDSLDLMSVRSLMCAPLWTAEGQALGAIQLDTRADDRKFTGDDLHLLLGVTSLASVALSNARLFRESLDNQRRARDLEVAGHVQRALLPRALPDVPGYGFCTHYAAAEQVGGDYYDFVPLPGGRLAILLGDVAGHGVAAALVMARFGAEARACLETDPDPAAAVARLNALVLRAAIPDSFVTLAGVILDPATGAGAVVSAGHPSPLVRRVDGTVAELVPYASCGPPLGVLDGPTYACCQVRLGPGESVLLFSDGVPEAMDGSERQFGVDRVRTVLATAGPDPRATIDALAAAVKQHSAGAAQNDDITLVCFTRRTN
jgi:serine phosphatase RsbU (regulator of sigma subunit)/pSer/pThr/pTyr-binding forkhead associated (FHA) protein